MANRQLIAGVDSSTQSVKVVIRDAHTGELVRQGRASHPDGTEVDPAHWLTAIHSAFKDAGGLDDVEAISIAGQQHGMVALDSAGEVIRPALLWNDTRSAQEANDLNREVGGDEEIARKVGSKLVASFTASKVRWMADHEPHNASRVASIALPHDWLSWQLQGGKDLSKLFTDRSDASGTGYFDPSTSHYREDIVRLALRHDQELTLPRIIEPSQFGGNTVAGIPIAAGAGDNAGAALGLQAQPGDVVVSLNAARILDAACRILGKTHDEVAQLALAAKPGANGLTLLPYFEGERTPNRPKATGVFAGMNLSNSNPEDIARAMVEGMLAGLADAVDSLVALGVGVNRILLIGGAAKNPAVPAIASGLFGREVLVPPAGEYVADGAAKQAAWALLGNLPRWDLGEVVHHNSAATPEVMIKYKELKHQTENW